MALSTSNDGWNDDFDGLLDVDDDGDDIDIDGRNPSFDP